MKSIAEKIRERQDKDAINEYIINQRDSGVGFRKIAEGLKSGFGLSLSHTSLKTYVDEYLSGEISTNEGVELLQKVITQIDGNRVDELIEELSGAYIDRVAIIRIKAQIIALIESNINDHLAGVDRLKTEYIKYLKDLESID